jgi:hypothetical protein
MYRFFSFAPVPVYGLMLSARLTRKRRVVAYNLHPVLAMAT